MKKMIDGKPNNIVPINSDTSLFHVDDLAVFVNHS